ncbi:conserved Plasmodium protein, unknown function [Plasmodium gallinaceum]|uniref:SHSP domain-containing protein n=1 Tax=Plasmodium gallinaceum TaxID=5849 RepID=A0A1J1H0F0_PLAGA|nr:conserved Plasmodium protein, unknown function [Plasmodium gallinaceum]CRG97002.1 conserved Plasmodium protein, unknown function [Plasmodium gallinaceum]
MDRIEVLKKNLNVEKVFSHLNWHELILDELSDDSHYEKLESYKNCNDLFSYPSQHNEDDYVSKKKALKKKKKLGNISNEKNYNCYSRDKCTNKNEEIEEKNEIAKSNTNNDYKCYFFQNISLFSYISNLFSREKKKYEMKKCNFIKEVKKGLTNKIDFIPPVNILYDDEKVIFLFFISGVLENFNIFTLNNYITISGKKVPYEVQRCTNYFSHEITTGYFMRTYYFTKSFDKEKIHYEHKNGVTQIYVYISNDHVL